VDTSSNDHRPSHEAFRIDASSIRIHRLADGTEVTVRMVRSEDRDAFLAGFDRLSPESRYLRFFSPMPRLPESMLHRLLHMDGIDHVALAAWRSVGGQEIEPIGVARFIRLVGRNDTAEAAVVVVDHMQRRRVGGLLLADLCEAARERGIRHFHAEVLFGNRAMTALLHELDADAKRVAVEGNVVVYELDVPSAPAARSAESLPFRLLRLVARGLEVAVGRGTSERRRVDPGG
jgi:GNAT superfamily N-acetyltransferase